MKRTAVFRKSARRLHRGAVAIEFALLSALFLMALLVGIIELARVFFYVNATAEATRLGARVAVVCDKSPEQEDVIRARMREYVNVLPADRIAFEYQPNNECLANESPICTSVTVRVLPGATFDTFIPFIPLQWTLPAFATTLPRESMSGTPGTNPVCN